MRFRSIRQWLLAILLSISGVVAVQGAPVSPLVVEGFLTVLNGDPDPRVGGGSKRLYILSADDGTRIELDIAATGLNGEALKLVLNQRVQVVIDEMPSTALKSESSRLRALQIRVVGYLKPTDLTGSQPFVSILCSFGGNAAQPRPPAYFQTELGNTYPGFNHYFREASYGTLNLDGSSVSSAWVDMPNPRTFYIDGVKKSGQYLDEMFKDCTNAAVPIVDFSKVYGINLMFNDVLDNAAWGGGNVHVLSGVNKAWPATWMPYSGEDNDFGWRNHGILAHEMSHAFGAPHSESPDGNEYGSQWDVVSSPGALCTIVDPNYGCVGQSMNAYAKATMTILAASRQATHAGGTQAYTIERLAQPPTPTSIVMLRIPITGTTTRFYTVESRHQTGYDAQLPGAGVIIHVVDTTKDRPARLVAQGGNGPNLGGVAAIWPAGSTFNSTADNVSIKVESFVANGTATVTVGPASGPTNSVLTLTKAGTGAGAVTSAPAGINCTATCNASFATGTAVTLTAVAAPGSVFTGWLGGCTGTQACVVNVNAATGVSATFAPNTVLLRIDIDGNGAYAALTDGLLILRYLLDLTGPALTNGATVAGAPRTTPADVSLLLDNIKPLLDVDGNGQCDALTDGLMLIRYFFGLRGNPLIAGAVGTGATRVTTLQIEDYIGSITPP